MTEAEIRHLEEIRPYLSECMVLLRKDGSFPLERPCTLALYGNGARHTEKGGMGSGEVNSRFFITAEQGLKKAGFSITSGDWLNGYDKVRARAEKEWIRQVKKDARKHHVQTIIESMGRIMPEPEYDLPTGDDHADACLYVLSRISGEGSDRTLTKGDYLLTDTEIRDIRKLNQKYEKFMLVLNTCGPVDLSPVMDCSNILVLSLLGVETGSALADVILGRCTPSGRLGEEWLRAEEVEGIREFGEKDETRYLEGIYVGYRGCESAGIRPLFAFGEGITYTDFAWNAEAVEVEKSIVSVTVDVDNIGNYEGKEVLEAYLSCPEGRLDKPLHALVSFGKSDLLKQGESGKVILKFDLRESASWDASVPGWVMEEGNYVVSLSSGNQDRRPVFVLHVGKTVLVKKTHVDLGSCGFDDPKPVLQKRPVLDALPVYEVSPDALKEEEPSIVEETIDPRIAKLSDEQLALLNIGSFDPKGGIAAIIGNSSQMVAGAAGDISPLYHDLCGKTLVMADGPAGLRLSTRYFEDEKGIHAMDEGMPASYVKYLSGMQRGIMHLLQKKPGRNTDVKEQYTTMIPIETAIAQTWNPEAAEAFGNMVGEEMEQFDIRLWLAPAMNIQRDPLCGRNFEYLSEDPYLTAMMAAGIVRGVQKHPGRYACIKHFACNNQETNRTNSSSQVSQRALREIYLKAFAMVIRMEHPHAVMTSYNLINGVHVSESRALCTDFLRKECGFDGLVMTDWVTAVDVFSKNAKYPAPTGDRVAMAGNDLFMPGSSREYHQILDGLKNGTVTRKQLEINASRVLKVCEGEEKNA